MKNLGIFLLCFAVVISVLSFNVDRSEFSFEQYLTKLSAIADERPDFPNASEITDVIDEYDETSLDQNSNGIVKSLKYIWTSLKLIYQVLVYIVKIVIYLVQMIAFIGTFAVTAFADLLVW